MAISKTKRNLVTLFIVALLISNSLIFICHSAFAANCGGVETNILSCDEDATGGSVIREVLKDVVSFLTIGIGILGVIGVSVAGIQYLTAGPNEQQVVKAKKRIFNVILGLAVFVSLFGVLGWLLQGNLLEDIEVQNISFTEQNVSLNTGETTSLKVSVYPLDAKNGNLTYTSDNAGVATVDSDGKVEAKSPGDATITATSSNGKTATATIKVNEPPKEEKKDNICNNQVGSQITWIGDSYSVESHSTIESKFSGISFGGSINDANSYIQSGKCVGNYNPANPSALDVLQRVVNAGQLKPILVMAVGTNESWNNTYVSRFKEIIKNSPNTKVIFVTARTNNYDYNSNNEVLRQLANSNNNYYLADWAAVYNPSYFSLQAVHPRANGGYDKWTDVINNSVKKACAE